MSSNTGERAGEATKGVFHSIGNVGEAIRGTVNSFADDVGDGVSGRDHHHGTTANTANPNTTGLTTSNDPAAHATTSNASTGVHPDAQRAGTEIEKGLNAVANKIDGTNSHTTTTTNTNTRV